MNAPKTRGKAARNAELLPMSRPLDTGETRAVLLMVGILALFLYFIRLILLPFVLAAVLAYVSTPLLDWLARRTRLPRTLFAIGLFVILVSLGAGLLAVAAQHIVAEFTGTTNDLQSAVENLVRQVIGGGTVHVFGQSLTANGIAQTVFNRIRDWFGQTDALVAITGYGVGTVVGAFLTVVVLFYFLVSGRSVARGLFWIVPPPRRALVARIWSRLDPVLKRYFIGVVGVVVYATIASYFGLGIILGIHHAELLALLTGILETVPVIGPMAAAIIAGLVSLRTATGLMSIIDYALYATVLRLSIDQIVGPIVLGRAAHVHPVLIIFCFLSGAILLGIPGVILAVPAALVVKNTLAVLYGDDAV